MELKTERLSIRSWQKADIQRYAKIASNPLVMKYIGNGDIQNYEDVSKFIAKAIMFERERGWTLWALENRANNDLMGFCGFALWQNEIEIGWRLDNMYWRSGYGTEAAVAVLNFGIKKFCFPKIVSIAQKQNIASIKIMQKIGLQFERETIDERCDREIVVYAKSY